VRLDSGNRSFLALLGLAVVLYIALGTAACALLSLLIYRLATDGTSAFGEHAWAVIPAALFLAINVAGPILGVRSLGQQLASSRQLRRRVAGLSRPSSQQLAVQAREAGLGRRVRVIDSPEPFSFAYGAWRPRVVVSQGLLDCATPEELRAVLIHERYHVRNLDPLKVVLARAVSATFFLIPALRALERRYLAGRELAADRRAVRACGRHSLAGALFKVVRGPSWPELGSAAAIGGPELLDERVAQLESGREPRSQLSRGALIASAAALSLLAAGFATAVIGLGGVGAAFGMSHAQMDGAGFGLVMSLGCTAPFLVGGWLAWRWYTA
jgi:Zn-dependent protease with chaperone function